MRALYRELGKHDYQLSDDHVFNMVRAYGTFTLEPVADIVGGYSIASVIAAVQSLPRYSLALRLRIAAVLVEEIELCLSV